jgi:hypothetical protein
MASDERTVKKTLEIVQNQCIVMLETECVRLGTVKLPRSIPTLASIPNCEYSKGLRGKGVQKDTKSDTSFPTP